MTNQYVARQEAFKIYRFDLIFYVSGSGDSTAFQNRLNHIRRHLMASRGVFRVFQGTSLLFYAAPAPTEEHGGINVTEGNDVTEQVHYDVGHGPRPMRFFVNNIIGLTARIEWSLMVQATSEDTVRAGNAEIVYADSRVNYSVDQVGANTRRLSGNIAFRNIRAGNVADFWSNNSRQVVVDGANFRGGLPLGGALPYLQTTFALPARFVRMSQDFTVDETENVLGYAIVDREIRGVGLPPDVLRGDVSIQTHTEGWWGLQPVWRTVSGEFEGPLNGATATLLERVIQIIESILEFDQPPKLTMVHSTDFVIPQLYVRNRLLFSITAMTPFAVSITEWDRFIGARIPELPVSLGHPTSVEGTGGAAGSGYSPFAQERLMPLAEGEGVANFAAAFFDNRKLTEARGDDFFLRTNAMTQFTVSVTVNEQNETITSNAAPFPSQDQLEQELVDLVINVSKGVETIEVKIVGNTLAFYTGGNQQAVLRGVMRKIVGVPDVNRIGDFIKGPKHNQTQSNSALGPLRMIRVHFTATVSLKGVAIARARQFPDGGIHDFARWASTIDGPAEGTGSIIGQIATRLGL